MLTVLAPMYAQSGCKGTTFLSNYQIFLLFILFMQKRFDYSGAYG